jgi:hypothetical protein
MSIHLIICFLLHFGLAFVCISFLLCGIWISGDTNNKECSLLESDVLYFGRNLLMLQSNMLPPKWKFIESLPDYRVLCSKSQCSLFLLFHVTLHLTFLIYSWSFCMHLWLFPCLQCPYYWGVNSHLMAQLIFISAVYPLILSFCILWLWVFLSSFFIISFHISLQSVYRNNHN